MIALYLILGVLHAAAVVLAFQANLLFVAFLCGFQSLLYLFSAGIEIHKGNQVVPLDEDKDP